MQSPGAGASAKHSTSLLSARSEVRSLTAWPWCWTTRRPSEHGTTLRSRSVANTTASSRSVRSVATSVPTGTRIVSSCGADSQKVTSVRAADGGNRVMPTRSRKARWFFSGTRLRRYTIWSAMWASVSTRVMPGSETLWSVHSGARCWM